MLLERLEARGLAQYTYFLADGGDAMVIDAHRDVEDSLQAAHKTDDRIRWVLETHRNEDFMVGSQTLADLTGAEIWHADGDLDYGYGRAVEDGRRWSLGDHTVEAIHTPGHTPGHMSYLLRTSDGTPWMLFSGDCLFAGGVGRTDLLGEGRLDELTGRLHDSLHSRVLPLGAHVLLFPAHGPGSACGSTIADRTWTTIGLEKALDPLLALEREEFVARQARMLERPPYFDAMERRNLQPDGLATVPWPPPLDPPAFARRAGDALVLDTRRPPAFLAAHVPGAVSIWRDGLGSWAGWLVRPDTPLLLVAEGDGLEPALRTLLRMGFDRVLGTLQGGMHAWHAGGLDSATIATVTAAELGRRSDAAEKIPVLDVRTPAEVETQILPGSQHVPLTELSDRLDEVPTDRPTYIFCGSGLRSTVAASLLARAGHDRLTVILGGMKGWNSAGLPAG
jgi:hydroxyacylglutathione hydrolase